MKRWNVFRSGLLLVAAVCSVVLIGSHAGSRAQTSDGTPIATPTPIYESRLLATAGLVFPADPRVTLFRVVIPPGFESATKTDNTGPLLVYVETGTLNMDASAALIGFAEDPSGVLEGPAVDASPVTDIAVSGGQQVLIPDGGEAVLRNRGDDTLRLLVVTLGATSTVTPSP